LRSPILVCSIITIFLAIPGVQYTCMPTANIARSRASDDKVPPNPSARALLPFFNKCERHAFGFVAGHAVLVVVVRVTGTSADRP